MKRQCHVALKNVGLHVLHNEGKHAKLKTNTKEG